MSHLSVQPEFALEPPLEFLRHLWWLNHALERRSSLMKRSLGVTAQQRLLLRCIGRYPGITGGQLARLLHLDPGTLSVGLARLERQRLLSRTRDPRNPRRRGLGLTAAGRRLAVPVPGTVEAIAETVLGRVGARGADRAKAVLAELAIAIASAPPPPLSRARR